MAMALSIARGHRMCIASDYQNRCSGGHEPANPRLRPGVRWQVKRDTAFERRSHSKRETSVRCRATSKSGVKATALQDHAGASTLCSEFAKTPPVVMTVQPDDVGGFCVRLSNDYRLDVFPDESDETCEYWRIFQPGVAGKHFVFRETVA